MNTVLVVLLSFLSIVYVSVVLVFFAIVIGRVSRNTPFFYKLLFLLEIISMAVLWPIFFLVEYFRKVEISDQTESDENTTG